MSESVRDFTMRLRRALHGEGAVTYRTNGDAPTGWPQLWIGHHSFSGWVSILEDDEPVGEVREFTLSVIADAGAQVGVIRPSMLPRSRPAGSAIDACATACAVMA